MLRLHVLFYPLPAAELVSRRGQKDSSDMSLGSLCL